MRSLKCLHFPGGGINYFWQAGAATYIRENCHIDNIQIVGSSAGSLTATLLMSGSDLESSITGAWKMMARYDVENNALGLCGIWGKCVRAWLDELIEEDSDMGNFENLHITVTHRNLVSGAELLKGFRTKDDLVDACLASVHIPWFMDGKMYATYRGNKYVDGALLQAVYRDNNRFPFPSGVNHSDEVYTCDYQRDHRYTHQFSGMPTRLISVMCASEMFEYGYNHMRSEHRRGELPWVSEEGGVYRMLYDCSAPTSSSPSLKQEGIALVGA